MPEVADGGSNWIPLDEYKGSINGGNYTISGLRIYANSGVYVGFVSILGTGGKIENLSIANAQVNSDQASTGIVAGVCRKGTTVTNCEVDNASTVIGKTEVGGIVGRAEGGLNQNSSPALTRISNCRNHATVSGTGDSYSAYVGGIVGYIENAVVERCSNYGAVSGYQSGGIVGKLHISVAMACLNNGTVFGTSSAGGIVGYQYAGSSNIFGSAYIVACGNEGGVSGSDDFGGIVGYMSQSAGAVYGSWTIDTNESSINNGKDGLGSGYPDSVDSAVGSSSDVNAKVSELNADINDYNTRITNKNNISYAGDASFWTCNYQWVTDNIGNYYPTL